METSAITLVKDAIHNPAEPRHFMKLKPVANRVRIWRGDLLLVDTTRAIRMLEVARDLYDPVLYLPKEDVLPTLEPHDLVTHCPLKGDASYFSLLDSDGNIIAEKIAWSYLAPIAPAAQIKGLIAFYSAGLRIEEQAPC